MKPISPIVPAFAHLEYVLAENQEPYIPLPVLPVDDAQKLISRWRLSWRERFRILIRGDLYVWVWTFGQRLQPIALDTRVPEISEAPK